MNDRILKTHRILLMMLGTYAIKILVSFSMQKMNVDFKMLFIMLTFILFLNYKEGIILFILSTIEIIKPEISIFYIMIAIPFIEEYLFRYKFYKNNSKTEYLIFAPLLNYIIHMPNVINEYYLVTGILFTIIYYKTNNIFITFLFHITLNYLIYNNFIIYEVSHINVIINYSIIFCYYVYMMRKEGRLNEYSINRI